MKPIIIGVGYKKRVGKDTFCDFLLAELRSRIGQPGIRKIGFADKLKDVTFQLYGWAGLQNGAYYEQHPEKKEVVLPRIGMSPREIWIKFGTDAVRGCVYQDTWIAYGLNLPCALVTIVKDVGFWNEATAVREKDGYLIKLTNNRAPNDGVDGREVELDSWTDWDAVYANDGSMAELHAFARKTATAIHARMLG